MRRQPHNWVSDPQTTRLLLKTRLEYPIYYVFVDSSILDPLEMDGPSPLSSYSYSKITINTVVNSKIDLLQSFTIYQSLGAEPPFPSFLCNSVVITTNS